MKGRIVGIFLTGLLLVGVAWGEGREAPVGTASPLFQESLQLALLQLQGGPPAGRNLPVAAEVPRTFNINCVPPGPGPSPGLRQVPTEQPTVGCTPTAECPITQICPTEACFPVTDCGPTCVPTQECYTACNLTQGCVPITDCEPICLGGTAGATSAKRVKDAAMLHGSGTQRLVLAVAGALKRLIGV